MNFNGADEFPLVMISAMYENGGNTTHRYLDGHPELFVYPFESQIGTRLVDDHWSSMYPVKYRWPEFRLSGSLVEDYRAIIDEEGKVRSRTPFVSKFRDWPFEMDDEERLERFLELMGSVPRTRPNLVSAFFAATFDVWRNLKRSGEEHVYVGYSPIFAIDADRFLDEMALGRILHVVRNPWSAYGETKRRPVPNSLRHYLAGWTSVQHMALASRERYGDRVQIVRFEDLIDDPRQALTGFCHSVGIDPLKLLDMPTWNGNPLNEVYPWGTIRAATKVENEARAAELSKQERAEVDRLVAPYAELLGYGRP